MSGVNRVILLGRLGSDPELKDAKGLAICNFSIATSKEWRTEDGEKKEKTEWHRIVAFKKTAELAGKYLTKGRQVYVEGELQTRSWEDDNGVKKYMTEIVANNIQFIGEGKATKDVDEAQTGFSDTGASAPSFNNSEEIPF